MNLYIYFKHSLALLFAFMLYIHQHTVAQFFFIKYAVYTTFKNLLEFYIALGHFQKCL